MALMHTPSFLCFIPQREGLGSFGIMKWGKRCVGCGMDPLAMGDWWSSCVLFLFLLQGNARQYWAFCACSLFSANHALVSPLGALICLWTLGVLMLPSILTDYPVKWWNMLVAKGVLADMMQPGNSNAPVCFCSPSCTLMTHHRKACLV